MSVVILDLDNTIADDSWRIPYINWKAENPFVKYHNYHSLSGFDTAGNIDLFKDSPHDIVIMTARPSIYAAVTLEWLHRQDIAPFELLMRPDNDHNHSRLLKMRQFRELRAKHDIQVEDVVAAYDDREDVCAMFKEFGIKAYCRPIHEICAYTNPKEIR